MHPLKPVTLELFMRRPTRIASTNLLNLVYSRYATSKTSMSSGSKT